MKIMIVGAGKLGYKIAKTMLNGNADVTMIDTNEKVLNLISEQLDVLTVNAHGGRVDLLKELNIKSYDLIIATTSNDETNILVGSIAKKLGCPKAIARVRNPEYADQLKFIKDAMKIDYVINPELATANEITRYLTQNYAFYSGEYAKGNISVVDFNVSNLKEFVGKRLRELEYMKHLMIVAISRNGETIVPHGDTMLEENDTIYVMGKKDNINTLASKKNITVKKKFVKRAMILGGGKLGYYLAKRLSEFGIIIKLIEENRKRCIELSEKLENVLVIHGNGTDIDLLEEEDLESMDAFIGVTGHDEDNLFMSLRAKQLNINKVIAKVSRQSHKQVIEKLGIDVALNPVNITASEIVRFIRGGNVVNVSLLLGGEAEITEIIVSPDLPFIGSQISKLGLPKGIIIGAVLHGNNAITPNGETIIHANDRLVIFCLHSEVPKLEKFFQLKMRLINR